MRSAWLSFIGAIAAFLLIGSAIQYILFVIPYVQIVITFLLYFSAQQAVKNLLKWINF